MKVECCDVCYQKGTLTKAEKYIKGKTKMGVLKLQICVPCLEKNKAEIGTQVSQLEAFLNKLWGV
jgi:hypothetical protein